MIHLFRISFTFIAVMIFIGGVIYPAFSTALAQLLFPYQANGSIIRINDKPIGSELIGQQFDSDGYFYSRPSAVGYNAASSGASNLAPSNNELTFRVNEDSIRVRVEKKNRKLIPIDLITTSGSGLDPHISAASANFQVMRIAKARGMNEKELEEIIVKNTEGRFLGIFGESKVNVLKLNMELDKLKK